MLSQYKNITEIQTAKQAVSAARISRSKTEFLSYDFAEPVTLNTDLLNVTDQHRIEFHVYAGDTWITGNHRINQVPKLPEYKDPLTNGIKQINAGIGIDIVQQFKDLKISNGNFRIAVNFFKNLICRFERQHLRIDEISPDRTEIRLRAIDVEDTEYLQEVTKYINTVDQTGAQFHKTYLLNFSCNQCVLFVNSVVIGEYLYVKLYEPLPTKFDVDFKCWVAEELKPTVLDLVTVSPISIAPQFNALAGPNWQANYSYNTSAEAGLSSWTDLLGSSLTTSQQIVDSYFSGSLSGMKLNIDYSDFNNFVFYSSATERIANFRYKLELIEYYTTQSLYTSTLSGSTATTNVSDFTTLKNNLIGGFDGFENYLYYATSSQLTTYNIPVEFATVPELTGSYLPPAPKATAVKPFTLFPVKSTEFNNWYNTAMKSASFYDTYNNNILTNAIPEYIRFDSENDNLIAFTNMLGQHYDILYTYINHMTKINKREENPKLGMPNELLYSVAKQFGWNLTNGKQNQKLWEYVLGTNEAGIPLTGSNSVGDPAVSGQDTTYAIWRRIVNNLPLLLKSKGTKRSIRALLACYGIPQSFVSINEYGGPRMARKPVYEKLNFDYALDLINNPSGKVEVEYQTAPKSIELRFRTADVVANPTMPSDMELLSIGGGTLDVRVIFISGNKGCLTINGNATGVIEMFDGGWLSVLITESAGDTYLTVKRAKYGKIVAEASVVATGITIPTGPETLSLGTSFTTDRLYGQLQELRLWSAELPIDAFDNHVKAPSAYNSVDAYSDLTFRLPLSEKINHATTASLYGVQPKASTITANFSNWTTNTPYDSLEETYYFDTPSGGAGTYDDNKVRLESNTLVGTLDIKTRAEQSAYDNAALDSNRLGVYFSPQTMIDEDIILQLGYVELDNFIGDPGQLKSTSYPALEQFAQSYWKKYSDRPNMNMYLNMFGLFDLSFFKQLEQLLPARVEKLTGIVIQPNILERNKSSVLPSVSREDATKYAYIENAAVTASGEHLLVNGALDGKVMSVSAQDDDQWQMYLTASVSEKYDGAIYSQQYLLKSGSGYITASSPYWLSEAVQPTIIANAISEFLYKSGSVTYSTGSVTGSGGGVGGYGTAVYGTSTYGASIIYSNPSGSGFEGILAEVSSYLPTGLANHRYNGSKMTSPAFNVNSLDTVDGGPVVEWTTANPNQLIYQSNGNEGSFQLQ
jgi:hypothetical protein